MTKAKSIKIKSQSEPDVKNIIIRKLKPLLERRTVARSRSGSESLQGTDWNSDALTPEHLKETAPDYKEIEVDPVEVDPVTEDNPKRKPVMAEHASLQERYELVMEEADD